MQYNAKSPFLQSTMNRAMQKRDQAASDLTSGKLNLTTSAGQSAYRQLNKDQRKAYDYQVQQQNIRQAEREMNKILSQRPQLKSAMGTSEMAAFQKEAYGKDPLAEFQSMRDQARLAQEQQRRGMEQGLSDELQNQSIGEAGAQANAYSQLAQGGGLSSGARERIASGLGQQSLAQRQAARLQTQRGLQGLESQYQQGLMDLTGKEAAQRRQMQNAYMDLQRGDIESQNRFAQEMYGKKADVMAGLAKARMDAAGQLMRKE